MKRIHLILAFIVLINPVFSQVRNVRENVEKDKKERNEQRATERRTSSGPSTSAPSIDDDITFGEFIAYSIAFFTVYGAYVGVHHAQIAMLNRSVKHPEIISVEGTMAAGLDLSNAFLLAPAVRGNYGLFASDVRFTLLNDVTGTLQTINWQILKLRIPIRNIKLEYGLGFSHFVSPSKTYFEQVVGFDWCFINRKATLQGEYRCSEDSSFGDRYRQEYNLSLDYEMLYNGAFRFAPFVGFAHQNYFEQDRFNFFKAGIKVRLF
jgi:hypothetical protein